MFAFIRLYLERSQLSFFIRTVFSLSLSLSLCQVQNLNLLTDSNRLLREERETLSQKVSELEGKSRQLSDDLQQLRETNRTLVGQKDALVAEKTALRLSFVVDLLSFLHFIHTAYERFMIAVLLYINILVSYLLTIMFFSSICPPLSLSVCLSLSLSLSLSGMKFKDGTLEPTNSLSSTTKLTLKITRDYCKYTSIN